MAAIRVLDEIVANQIAAGEVVERPASVVKELIENAVDAGATQLTVEIDDGGVSRLRIVDNGKGMDRDDLTLSVIRHATSKLRCADDLQSIGTLGFRGEALPSIASVSRLKIRTRQPDGLGALQLSLIGGRDAEVRDVPGPVGTEVIVEDLFFNVPARRKFLKTEATEASHVQDIVQRVGLCYPNLGIRYIRDGRTVCEYAPNSGLRNRIREAFGAQYSDGLIDVSVPGAFGLDGMIGHPRHARSTPRHYHIFINGRYVRDKVVMSAVQQAYGHRLSKGKHPFVVLRLRMPAQLVDVNVHPAKTEVRFSDSRSVHRLVAKSLDVAFREHPLDSASPPAPEGANLEYTQPGPSIPCPTPMGSPVRPAATSGNLTRGRSEQRDRILDAMNRVAERRTSRGHGGSLGGGRRLAPRALGAQSTEPGTYSPNPRQGSLNLSAVVETGGNLGQSAETAERDEIKSARTAGDNQKAAAGGAERCFLGAFTGGPGETWQGFEFIGVVGRVGLLAAQDGIVAFDHVIARQIVEFDRIMKLTNGTSVGTPPSFEMSGERRERWVQRHEKIVQAGISIEEFGGGTHVIREGPYGVRPKALLDTVFWCLDYEQGFEKLDERAIKWRLAQNNVDSESSPQDRRGFLRNLSLIAHWPFPVPSFARTITEREFMGMFK